MEIKETILIIVLFIVAISFSYFYTSDVFDSDGEISQVCFVENCFNVEIADTEESRALGLMFRESLASDSGMLFIFEQEGVYPFWMKNTLIPLDIIWLDRNQRVVAIIKAVPCDTKECFSYDPRRTALYVLEVNSGVATELNLRVGDRLEFRYN